MKTGAFEGSLLLVVGVLTANAYRVSMKFLLEENTGKGVSTGALHSTLNRLEDKGCLTASECGVTAAKGGRRNKYYTLTARGRNVLIETSKPRPGLLKNIQGLNLRWDG